MKKRKGNGEIFIFREFVFVGRVAFVLCVSILWLFRILLGHEAWLVLVHTDW